MVTRGKKTVESRGITISQPALEETHLCRIRAMKYETHSLVFYFPVALETWAGHGDEYIILIQI